MQKVYFAVVAYGAVEWEWARSVIDLVQNAKVEIKLAANVGDSLVSRSRNTITADFLKSDCTDLVFIDTDIGFTADHFHRLCQHNEDVVAGFYPKKQEGPVQWVCNAPKDRVAEIREDGLQSLLYMGTGFMRIRRRVFDQMIGRYGDQIGYKADDNGEPQYDFWGVGVHTYKDGSKRYLSEDWMFCQRAIDLGFPVWGDTQIMLRHVGKMTFPNNSQMEQIREANEKHAAKLRLNSVPNGTDGSGADSSPLSTCSRTITPVESVATKETA